MSKGAKLFALALLASGVLAGVAWLRRGPHTPAEGLAAVQAKIARGQTDDQSLLGDLASVVGSAEQAGDVETAARARLVRGRMLLELGALESAREDLDACLDHAPRDVEVRTLLVELEARSGALDQAVARARSLVEEDPTRTALWTRLGGLHEERAARRLATCGESVRRALAREDEQRAQALLEEGAALAREDPRRRVLSLRLGEVFGEGSLERLQEARLAMDEAGDALAAARAAYAASLEQGPTPEAAGRLLELLERAGRSDDVLDLGLAALRRPELRRSSELLAPLARALDARGRHAFGSELAFWITQEGLAADADLVERCIWIHTRAQQWNRMLQSLKPLLQTGSTTQHRLVKFLTGWANDKLRNYYPDSLYALRTWVGYQEPESYAGQRSDAWLAIAHHLEALGGEAWERREALEACLREQPDRDGELWLELAELYASERHGGYRLPEERWARGMALLPQRAEELFGRWKELGELELAADSFDPALLQQSLVANASWTPPTDLDPYQLWRLMEVQSERNDLERALASAKRLLEILPGFVPAFDQAIPLALRLRRPAEARTLLLARLDVVGHDARSAEWLRQIPEELFDGADRLRMMRAAPQTLGRTLLARALLERGVGPAVLAVLGELSGSQGDPEVRRLAARVALELGEPERAAELVGELSLMPRRRSDDLALVVGLELALDGETRLPKLVEELEPARLRDDAEALSSWLTTCDRLLAAGRDELAARLAARLDDEGPSGGAVLLRRALTELALGRAVPARNALDRAEAFDRSGRPALARLVLASELEPESDLAQAVAELRASSYVTSPLQEAALELLAGETASAREHLSAPPSPGAPAAALLACAARLAAGEELELPAAFGRGALPQAQALLEQPAARRALLALLVAREDPLLEPYAANRLERLAKAEDNPWLQVLALASLRDPALTGLRRAALEELLAERPAFAPAREEYARMNRALGEETPPQALAGEGGPLAQARAAQLAGRPRLAIQILQGVREGATDLADVHRRLGKLYGELGLVQQALDSYLASFAAGERAASKGKARGADAQAEDARALHEFVELLEHARSHGQLELAREGEIVAELEARFPRDPDVALARARHELVSDPRNPALALARANAALERFRREQAHEGLDALRRGAAESWVRFQLAVDPARGRALAEHELALDPGSLSSWILLGEALVAEGREREAYAHFRVVEQLAPRDEHVQRELLALEARGLAEREAVNARASAIRALASGAPGQGSAGGAGDAADDDAPGAGDQRPADAEIVYWRATALFLGGARTLAGAAGRFASVWAERATLPDSIERSALAQRYVAALIAAGGEENLALAQTLAQGLAERPGEPDRVELARALRGIAAAR